MPTREGIGWFKEKFGARIRTAVAGTVFDTDMLTALACQETGSLWNVMRRDPALTVDRIAALCCGDTLDADKGRGAFPRFKADLVAVPDGARMFDIARQALLAMAAHVPGYEFALNRPNKFAHGYGVFQYDLQFFLTNPSYFLEKRYEIFENSLERALGELKTGQKKLGLQGRSSITDLEFCQIAIAYNTGGFDPAQGLRQGHKDGTKFYGEFIRDFLVLARTVAVAGAPAVVPAPPVGTTTLPPPGTIGATGPKFRVDTKADPLRLRDAPRVSSPPTANVKAELPDGLVVTSISGAEVNGFIEVETMLGDKLFRGFASAKFMVRVTPAQATAATNVVAPPVTPPLPQAHLTHAPGSVTKRTAIAGAHSLNEPDMPRRTGGDPATLRSELAAIIAYLGVDNVANKRYRPRDGLTFCNIYAHDYTDLAGCYLPRVWWNGPALIKIAAGQTVPALLGNTVDEVRANTLFRWFRDFGPSFGWRRAVTTTELQDHANLGGVCIIVARRKEEGKSGHIVAVVPETTTESAKRDATGAVVMPLQSQAGAVNFRYGRSDLKWWTDPKFAEFAFWMHS
jgi:hypothetical protein